MDLEVVRYDVLTNYYPYLPKIGFNNNVFILISSYL
jgi:hypothetical protein